MNRVDRIVRRAIELQAIPAPTFHEGARSEYLRKEFHRVGFAECENDAAGNLLTRIPGGAVSPLVISAHMDSVIHPGEGQPAARQNGRVVGPGIGDNAIALSALVEVGGRLLDSNPPGDIWLVANVAEEGLGNLLGMQHVVERFGSQVSAYIVLEGLSLGFVYHKALPVRRFRIEARSQGGHSWSRNTRGSSVHALIELGHTLLSLPLPENPRTTLNLGRIEGGASVNSLASRAHLDLDLRSESERVADRLSRKIGQAVRRHNDQDVEISIEAIGHRPAGALPRRHPLVRAATDAVKAAGIPDVKGSSGSTDASLPISLGLPAVCIGITRGGGAHSLEEFIEIDPIEQGLQSVLNLVERVFAAKSAREGWLDPLSL